MIFQYLYVLNLIGREVAACHSILVAHQVKTLDIELVDGFALIEYLSVVFYLHTRHLADDICYRAVLFLLEARNRICDGVLVLYYSVGLDLDFL